MKNHACLRTLVLAASLSSMAAGPALAQDATISWNPRSGDVWIDTWLDDVNDYGHRYRQPFVDEVVRYHDAPRDLVTGLLANGWAPGDVYYACAIADIIGRPCRYVADQWEQDRGQGWGALAKRLGIKPGSDEFHRLKRGFVSTYDRWGRPIRIDDDLFDDYPDRARLIREDRGRGNDNGNRGRGNEKAKGNSGRGNAGKGNNGNNGKGNRGKGNNGNGNGKGKGNNGRGN